MHMLAQIGSYGTIVMGLLSSVIIYRGQKHKAKEIVDPWRPYLWTGLIIIFLFTTVSFILRTSHY